MDFISRLFHALTVTHPLHGMVVHFPIGLSGAALLFIMVALWRRSEAFEKAAFFSISLAAVSTVVAAIAGIRDNIVRFDGGAPLVNAKIFLAITLFVLTTVTAISRRKQQDILWKPSTMVLYFSAFLGSFGLAIVLGFFGGVILYGL